MVYFISISGIVDHVSIEWVDVNFIRFPHHGVLVLVAVPFFTSAKPTSPSKAVDMASTMVAFFYPVLKRANGVIIFMW